jgi:hypothetical protein
MGLGVESFLLSYGSVRRFLPLNVISRPEAMVSSQLWCSAKNPRRHASSERSLIYHSRQDHYRRAEKSRNLAASGVGFSPVKLSPNNPEI